MNTLIDLTGARFGKLTVIEQAESKNGKTRWACLCDCGVTTCVRSSHLRNGRAKSCGCSAFGNDNSTKHGMYGTRIYTSWCQMKARCLNPKATNYKNYGARGITVYKEWVDNFAAFRDWAVTHGYADNLTLDRVDVNGNYCPENCRWATPKEQGNNRRDNKLLTYKGETRTQQEWAELKGLTKGTLYGRLRRGWTVERALDTPTK